MTAGPAQSFLISFRDAATRGEALEMLADDVGGFVAALGEAPDDLAAAMAAAADAGGGTADVAASMFASAACTADGRIVAADAAFAAWDIPERSLADAVALAGPGEPRLSAIADDVSGRPVALAVASPHRARAWPLGEAVRAALESGAAAYAVLGVHGVDGGAWSQVFAAWGFSASEGRVAAALVRTGDLRRAALAAGVAYETARGCVAEAMAKTGARRQPELVRQLTLLAFSDLPSDDATWRTFADVYGLTVRQSRVAQLIALGATRAAAAGALGISDQSAKADLKVVYEQCDIDGGAALGRIVAELDALTRLASATDVTIRVPGTAPEPLRFIRRRRAPGRIAVADHGPAEGVPVIVLHTPLSGRHLSGTLVEALQAKGMRPISVERPGFGLTSPLAGDVADDANADLIDVLDALEIDRVGLLARSIPMALRFAAAHPGRFTRGVLLSSGVPPGRRSRNGLIGAGVALALDHPRLIRGFAAMLARVSSEAATIKMVERVIGGCPSDVAAFADPRNRRDFVRGARQASVGDGFAREVVLHADGGEVPAAARGLDWTVLVGGLDGMAVGVEVADGWREALPRAHITVIPQAGRFLFMSHAAEVAAVMAAGR